MRDWRKMCDAMIREQIVARGVHCQSVLDAMRHVPREQFVPAEFLSLAYADQALPIGLGQTISQPFVVALMSQMTEPDTDGDVLEIGTGCGYQTAILSRLFKQVTSLEIVQPLHEQATARLKSLGCENVRTILGDGNAGWSRHAPYDAILVAAAPAQIPSCLPDQLKPHGRLVIPVGTTRQQLLQLVKRNDGQLDQVSSTPVSFVPMTGERS